MVAGAARIRVTFEVDADGLLDVAAREQTTGIEATITVKPSYGLTDGEIAQMLKDSFAHAADDMQARALAEAQVEADQIAAGDARLRSRPTASCSTTASAPRSTRRSRDSRGARDGSDHRRAARRRRSAQSRHRRVRRHGAWTAASRAR